MSQPGKQQKKAEKRKRRERTVRKLKARQRTEHQGSAKLQERAATEDLPIEECLISKGWKKRGLAHILLSRRKAKDELVVAGYYVDTLCLGLKDTVLLPAVAREEYESQVKTGLFHDTITLENCDPGVARAIVEGAITFAGRYGFRPNKRWEQSRRLLAGIEAKPKKISFGRAGKPCLVLRKGESLSGAQRRLERNFEPGEYTVEEGESLR